jgi:hypothetical protein
MSTHQLRRRTPDRGVRSRRRLLGATALAALAYAPHAQAQTDYYNTDAGRPVRIEDAYPTERYAFELQLAPLRAERSGGGAYAWGIEPEIAYGILPRTHIELGVPLMAIDAPGVPGRSGAAGIELSMLHNLNTETASLPALAIAAHALLPAGAFGPERAIPSFTALVTRTFSRVRVHVNGQYTFANADDAGAALELSQWLAGVALDRTLPLRSMLVTAEAYAEEPLHDDEPIAWTIGAGVRTQRTPRLTFDAGLGRRVTGPDTGWYVTAGAGYAFAIRGLMPGGGR